MKYWETKGQFFFRISKVVLQILSNVRELISPIFDVYWGDVWVFWLVHSLTTIFRVRSWEQWLVKAWRSFCCLGGWFPPRSCPTWSWSGTTPPRRMIPISGTVWEPSSQSMHSLAGKYSTITVAYTCMLAPVLMNLVSFRKYFIR